jgi:hypothetical protein
MSEIPVHPHPRRLADWLNPTEAKKVHSLIDKVYERKNLAMAWERVRANRGSEELIQWLNPVLRGWGNYFKRAHVRRLFNRLDRWVVRRIWSHRLKHWRCAGWRVLPEARLYGEFGLVNLVGLIPSIASRATAATS